MMLIVPETIEYCIEVMEGSKKPPVDKWQHTVKLARYDVSFVHNAMYYIANGQGLTELQRNLAVKLTLKYRRQFKKMGLAVEPIVENPVWKTPLREVDRTKSVEVDDNFIYIRFPYEQDKIKELHQKVRDGVLIDEGMKSQWNPELKFWKFEKLEPNFIHLYNWAKDIGFTVGEKMEQEYKSYEKILDNKSKYSIHASIKDGQIVLNNAPEELENYWNKKVAHLSDLEKVKKCTELAIKLDNEVLNYYNYNSIQKTVLSNRKMKIDCTLKEAVFNCFDIGFKNIAIGLSSHSPKNILEVKDIRKTFISRGYEPSQFVVNAKNTALNNVSDYHVATGPTRIVITDRMSRLNNNTFDFTPDVMIGFGMYSERNVFGAKKIITLPPQSEETPF